MEDAAKILQALLEDAPTQVLPTSLIGHISGPVYLGWAVYPGRGVMGGLVLTLFCPRCRRGHMFRDFVGCN